MQQAPVFPLMNLPQLQFQILHGINVDNSTNELMSFIEKHEMTPYYLHLVQELRWKPNQELIKKMKNGNEVELKKLEDKLEDAEKNFGETEVFDALMSIAWFYARIGDKDKSSTAFRNAFEKAVGAGSKLDICFGQLRVGIFFNDQDLINRQIDKAQALIDEGGDWDRRNRLKVYRGIHLLSIRSFKQATPLLLDGLATFTSTELMSYREFVKYTIIAAILTVERADLKKKVIESPEILEVLHEIPHLQDYLNSLYNCKYGQFFQTLAAVETMLKNDRFLFQHYHWYTREMRILAYKQILESYQSLSIDSMAKHFGVSHEFIDRDVSKFIAGGRLHCVIDKVGGVIETNRPDSKNAQYQQCVKQGDILLNRIQKLGRVINV